MTVRIPITVQIQTPSAGESLTEQQLVATVVFMKAVEIKMLNSRLSEYVRLAAAGESILVTERGRVVAEIGPPRETRNPVSPDAMLAEAVCQGWLTPPTLQTSEPPPKPEPVVSLRRLLSALDDDRGDRGSTSMPPKHTAGGSSRR